MDNAAIDRFIESWGMMGSIWGINASMARVHALLIATEEAISLDDIATRLKISRGNASMSLRELRNWNIVHLVKKPGDRQDYYVTESDIWKIFVLITKERKRREFDPVMEVVSETISGLKKDSSDSVTGRLKDMEKLLSTMNTLGERFLTDEGKIRYVFSVLSKLPIGKGKSKDKDKRKEKRR